MVRFRPNTKISEIHLNFVFNQGGMGDLLNYTGATTWLARNCPWIKGTVYAPLYTTTILSDIHAPFKKWDVLPSEKAIIKTDRVAHIIGPSLKANGVEISKQLLSITGSHQFDVGFAYYVDMTPPPKDAVLPILNYSAKKLPQQIKDLNGKYAVVLTAGDWETRRVTGRHINPIIEHLLKRGITPVFLGKTNFVGTNSRTVSYADDIEFNKGLDLRNQTSLKDAACIMQHAAMTIGVDCGLLHLAAIMQDSKLIFGYTITSIQHRKPRRNHGACVDLAVSDEELVCSGCQSKYKKLVGHSFDKCLYGDVKCIDLLFKEDSRRWVEAIDSLL